MCKKRGFTLIELLVVILIIGILAAAALPQYQLAVYKTRFVNIMPLTHKLVEAQEVYYMANGRYSRDLAELDISYPANCKYTQTSQTNEWGYDTLTCPDVEFNLRVDYGGIVAYVKKCPVNKHSCASYQVPFNVHGGWMGRGPRCVPYGQDGSKEAAFGEKVCLSLGGKKETESWGDRYYL